METTAAVGMTELQGRGRAMVALRPIKGGEIVLRDSPILLYSALPFHSDDHRNNNNTYCSNCFINISQQSQIINCSTCTSQFCTLACQSIASTTSHTPWACQTLIHLREYFSSNRLPPDLQIQARYLVSAYNLALISQSKFQILLSLQGSDSDLDSSSDYSGANFIHSLISSVSPPLPVELGFSPDLTRVLLAKDKLNAFGLMEPYSEQNEERSVRAYGIYPVASFFNHDCLPNACRFDYLDIIKPSSLTAHNTEISIRMIHDVPQGREVCLSYFPVNLKYTERQKRLSDDYGFVCDCDRCKVEAGWSESDEDGLAMDDDDDVNEEDVDEQMEGEDGELTKGEDEFPHSYFFLNFMCDRTNCWGTLAPLPPSVAAISGVMECNVCGNFKNLDQNENTLAGYESSSSNEFESSSNEFDEWEERVRQQNRQLDDIIIDLLISMPNMIIRDHPSRARKRYYDRKREQSEARLMEDYFVDNPTYDQATFRRRFRMRRPLFLRIVAALTANDKYFQQRRDATSRQGLSPLHKCTQAMRVLAYGTSAEAQDEYLRISETVTRDVLIKFVEGIISCFSQEYLRRPNEDDLARLLHVGEERGFPGMIGSIGCMHWCWENSQAAWTEQYAGKSGKPTIILEAVASYDLWIWHTFFGTPSSCNDINVLHRSPFFNDVLSGQAPNLSYAVNGRENNSAYYLTDGVYPSWAAFVKSIIAPQLRKHKLFAQHQEAVRKDVERAFRVLQVRFAFLRQPCFMWDRDIMGKIMIACIIIHNMIVEDERDTCLHHYDSSELLDHTTTNRQQTSSTELDEQHFQYSTQRIASLSRYMTNTTQLRNREAHVALKNDLIEHIWQKFGVNE